MAKYHFDLSDKPINTGSTKCGSAVAAASYITGDKLLDEQDGLVKDSAPDRDDLAYSGNFGFDGSTQDLWNEATAADLKKDGTQKVTAITARKIVIALDHRLPIKINVEIMKSVGSELRNRYGCAGTIVVHDPRLSDDPGLGPDSKLNVHGHIQFTARAIDDHGNWAKTKYRDLAKDTSSAELHHFREFTEKLINHHLEKSGIDDRTDRRSKNQKFLDDDGPLLERTRHLGPKFLGMVKRKIDKGQELPKLYIDQLAIKTRNAVKLELWNLKQAQKKAKAKLAGLLSKSKPKSQVASKPAPTKSFGELQDERYKQRTADAKKKREAAAKNPRKRRRRTR